MTVRCHTRQLADDARELRAGTLSVAAYDATIREHVEAVEPDIRAFVSEARRWERLQAEGTALSARYPASADRPELYAIPVGIKDIVHVEGLLTKAGTDVPPKSFAGEEATIVRRLRDAGGRVLGKTVTTEFAYFEPGPTRNPHALSHTPGGSSSGSAAAVAAGMCPLAIGTQTIGSVIRPAAFCGIVGVKPSYGRIPMDGVVPVAPSIDHLGMFTQTVADARLAASVVCADWTDEGGETELQAIGAVEGAYLEQASDTAKRHFREHLARIEATGVDVVRVDPFPDIDAINDRHHTLMYAEMARVHRERYERYGDCYADSTSAAIQRGSAIDDDRLATARTGRLALRRDIHEILEAHDLELLVSPSAPGPPPEGLDSTGDPVMNLPWTHAGVPTVTIPASQTSEGLPMGVQCVTRFERDEALLRLAEPIEEALT